MVKGCSFKPVLLCGANFFKSCGIFETLGSVGRSGGSGVGDCGGSGSGTGSGGVGVGGEDVWVMLLFVLWHMCYP